MMAKRHLLPVIIRKDLPEQWKLLVLIQENDTWEVARLIQPRWDVMDMRERFYVIGHGARGPADELARSTFVGVVRLRLGQATTREDFECWEPLNTLFSTQPFVQLSIAVYCIKRDEWTQILSGLAVLGSHPLTVPAPWGDKRNHARPITPHSPAKPFWVQHLDLGIRRKYGCRHYCGQ